MATSKVTLKLLINKTEGKLLFAEANKDFVDFLFYILSLPIGSIVKQLLKNKNVVGCLGELYQSIEALSETYMLSNQTKNSVLNPISPSCPTQILHLAVMSSSTFYSPQSGTSTAEAEGGFVKDAVSYMVKDNLEVKPMSSISCITLINEFNVQDLGSIEERIVDFGPDELLKLLKASMEMESENVLTSVFLGKVKA